MKTTWWLIAIHVAGFISPVISAKAQHQPSLEITIINCFNNQPLEIDSPYTNVHNENFTISQLKYYIGNIALRQSSNKIYHKTNSYHLTDATDSSSGKIPLYFPPGNYDAISFSIGVDSIKNVSGAQTGPLDPLNGMFWTWNSGYIMFKLEGNSPQSVAVNNKIEYHIGGFSGPFNVLRKITLALPAGAIVLSDKSVTKIAVRFNLDKIWKGDIDLKIAAIPVCTTPGKLAANIADNYSKAFEIIKIVQQKETL